MRYRGEDDDGQIDGDFAGPAQFAPFQPVNAGQPWLRTPMPPWHLWGDSQTLTFPTIGTTTEPAQATQQLVRVSYRRPETWHWLFAAQLLEAPAALAAQQGVVFVVFDLIVGVGRSAIVLPNFETYSWTWVGPVLAPVNQMTFSTQVRAPNRAIVTPAPATPIDNVVDQINAQDLQISARVLVAQTGGMTGQVRVQVSAQVAPKTHVRPDWMMEGPAEAVFAGSETEGR